MLPFRGGRYDSSGILGTMGVRKAKIGTGDKDPAYILAQNTCLKIVIITFVFVFSLVVVLGTTIYKVELRSQIAETATETEKVVSRLEERDAHHRLIEAHVNLRDALKGQVSDLQDAGAFYHRLQHEIRHLKKALQPSIGEKEQKQLETFEKTLITMVHGLLEGFSSRGRRASDMLAQMDRATKSEVERDQQEEDAYHEFFMKDKGRTHDEVAKLEEEAGGAGSDKARGSIDRKSYARVKAVVEAVVKWHDEEYGSFNGVDKFKGYHPTKEDLTAWKTLVNQVEQAMVEAAMGSPGKRDLRPLQHKMQNDMHRVGWDFPKSARLKGLKAHMNKMITAAGVVLNADKIVELKKRYKEHQDVYRAMDDIEQLMVDDIIPKDIVNEAYGQVRASEHKCKYIGPHPRTYLLPFMGGEGAKGYSTLQEAQEACTAKVECGGVTQEGDNFTIRRGSKLSKSKLGPVRNPQTSWVKDCRDEPINTDEQIIEAQAEAIAGFF